LSFEHASPSPLLFRSGIHEAGVYNRVMGNNLLVTGLPATGKTTLVMRLGDRVKGVKAEACIR